MEQFTHFIINHWELWLALVVVVILIILEETKGGAKGVKKIVAQEAVNLINHEKAIVIDVRSEKEFQIRHIAASKNIAITDLEQNLKKLARYKNKPIILVCNAGQLSLKAGTILNKNGFTDLYSLTGGLSGWQRSGMPLTKD